MILFKSKITGTLARLSEYFIALGPFGLFAVALLDSTFVPLPSSVDALMILLTTAKPGWMVIYAVMATLGSTIGCLILYYISRRAGSRALSRFSPSKQKKVKDWIDRYDLLSVLVASLMPPPFPFKLFVATAGVFRFSVIRFTIAIVGGRLFRFLLEGYLAIRYGAQAKEVLAKYYPWIGLGVVVVVVVVFFARRSMRRRKTIAVEAGLESGS